LKTVRYPGYSRDIVSFGLVQRVSVEDGTAVVTLDMASLPAGAQQAIAEAIHEALRSIPELDALQVQLPQPTRLQGPAAGHLGAAPAPRYPEIRHVIAVGSGKGGVGKSTVAVNLAVALAQQGLGAGLLDADPYGPNVPRMLGVDHLPPNANGKLVPARAHGVQVVSIGFMTRPEQPLIWRGPMTDKMVRQFLADVAWQALDVLVVDLPPSTGDVPLSLAKHVHVDGALLVVTPQAVAADDALKAIGMFRQTGVPVLGVVENMSYFVCDTCATRHFLFGQGGGRRLALAAGVPFLGEIPFEPSVREGGDEGSPAVLRPASAAGAVLTELAGQLRQMLNPEERTQERRQQ
jgi:ATP-binding protein involved in chromosome partitioning